MKRKIILPLIIIIAVFVLIGGSIVYYYVIKLTKLQTVSQTQQIQNQQQTPSQKINQTNNGNIQYEMIRVRDTNFTIPQIVKFSNVSVMKKVNQQLKLIADEFSCDKANTGYFNVEDSVTYNSNDIFSVRIVSSYFCGGAHPTNYNNTSVTFDMKTGNIVPFVYLFKNYDSDRKKIANIIFLSFSSKEQFIKTGRDESVAKDCVDIYNQVIDGLLNTEESTAYLSEYPYIPGDISYYISDNNIIANLNLPNVVAVCIEEVEVPISNISQYISSGGILTRILSTKK